MHQIFRKIVNDRNMIKVAEQNLQKRDWMIQKVAKDIAVVDTLISKKPSKKIIEPSTEQSSIELPSERASEVKATKKNDDEPHPLNRLTLRITVPDNLRATYGPTNNWVDIKPKNISLGTGKRPTSRPTTPMPEVPNRNLIEYFVNQERKILTAQKKKKFAPLRGLSNLRGTASSPMLLKSDDYAMSRLETSGSKIQARESMEGGGHYTFRPVSAFSGKGGFRSFTDASPSKREEIYIADKGIVSQPLDKSFTHKERAYVPATAMSDSKVFKEGQMKKIDGFRSLFVKLKLDKVFGEGKDLVDSMFSGSKIRSTNNTQNQELSFAIKSFAKDSTIINKSTIGSPTLLDNSMNETLKQPSAARAKLQRIIAKQSTSKTTR